MGVQVTGTQLQWSQLSPAKTIPSQAPCALVSHLRSANRRGATAVRGRNRVFSSPFVCSCVGKLLRSRSVENLRVTRPCKKKTIRRVASASFERLDDEDNEAFVRRIEKLGIELQHQQGNSDWMIDEGESSASSPASLSEKQEPSTESPWLPLRPETPDWSEQSVLASIEMKANGVEIPLSLRILRRQNRQDGWFREAGESAYCSVKRAFSSMVFMIRELHSYMLQMREIVFREDLQGILARVQHEMNSSFVWLFQQIFSCTPTLMVAIMLLLANFTVFSMGKLDGTCMAAHKPPAQQSLVEAVVVEDHSNSRPDRSSVVKTFSSVGRAASVGDSGAGGGGKARPVAGATGDERSDDGSSYQTILPYEISTAPATTNSEEVGGSKEAASNPVATAATEARIWKEMLDEAFRMQASTTDDALIDRETRRNLVAPVTVKLEPDECLEYLHTEIMYQKALLQEPENPLLLANFAQFLYRVLHDHDRAECYFKRAAAVAPADAEALGKYASFLWLARNDMEAAEETYLQAIDAEPGNTFHAANYAHFLWNTGGVDTCYPLDDDDDHAE